MRWRSTTLVKPSRCVSDKKKFEERSLTFFLTEYLARPGRDTDSGSFAFVTLLEHIHHTHIATWAEVSVTDQELYTRSMTISLPGIMEFYVLLHKNKFNS